MSTDESLEDRLIALVGLWLSGGITSAEADQSLRTLRDLARESVLNVADVTDMREYVLKALDAIELATLLIATGQDNAGVYVERWASIARQA